MFKLKKDINHYEGIITVFALISVVIYSSEKYDLWDVYLGVIVTYIAYYGYWSKAKEENDFFYSFLTSTILSLGIISILAGLFYTFTIFILKIFAPYRLARIETYSIFLQDYQFEINNIQFFTFIILLIFFMIKIKSHNNTLEKKQGDTCDNSSISASKS